MNRPAHASYDRHAEQAVLGCLMRDEAVLHHLGRLEPADFGDPGLGQLFDLVRSRIAAGEPVDEVALPAALMQSPIPGVELVEVLGLPDVPPSTVAASSYGEIVREHANRRRLRAVLADALQRVDGDRRSAAEVRAELMAQLDDEALAADAPADSWVHLSDALGAALDTIAERQAPDRTPGVPMPWRDVRLLVPALDRGRLYLLAARPAMGKSAIAAGIATPTAMQGIGVAAFVLEMTPSEWAERNLLAATGLDGLDVRRGRVDQRAWDLLLEAGENLASLPMYLCARTDVTIDAIRTQVRHVARRLEHDGHPLGLVVVDYLQLVDAKVRRGESYATAVGRISRGLKIMAVELNVAVLALSQLNRQCEQRANHRPLLADLRDSGSLEQDADAVLFVYRDEVYDEDSPDRGLAEVIVAKQRNGPKGMAKLRFEPSCTRFSGIGGS